MLRFAGCLIVLLSWCSFCSSLAASERRVALIIGNSHYKEVGNRLVNPVNDAELMAKTLSAVGFAVTKVVNAGLTEMRKAMTEYSRRLAQPNTVGLFYYAGHGMQVEGQNYLLPVDASLVHKDDLSWSAVAVNDFLRTLDSLSGRDGRLNVVILDACRNNPFARGWRSVSRGLATVDAPSGTLIAFATAPGDVAADGSEGNSPYTLALAEMIKRPGLAIEQTFKGARLLVRKRTQKSGKVQVPWESTSLTGDFYFVPEKTVNPPSAPQPSARLKEKSPLVVAKGPTVRQPKKAGDCVALSGKLSAPLLVHKGMKLCSKNKIDRAVIKWVRKRGVSYSVNNGYSITCTLSDLCQFDWVEEAPLFKVRIVARGKDSGYQAYLVAP